MGYDSKISSKIVTGSLANEETLPVVRSVITAFTSAGIANNAKISAEGAITVSIDDPHSAFGNIRVSDQYPAIAISSVYGIRNSDIEIFNVLNSTASVEQNKFKCYTSGSVGGYSVIRSLRASPYRPGTGVTYRFTAAWPSGSHPLAFQMAGAFNVNDGLFFGYNGEEFGILNRLSGSNVIQECVLSVPATGSNQVTVTLNGISYQVPVTAGTLSHNAYEISTGSFSGWIVTQNSSSLVFFKENPGAATGSYSITSNGALTGTFTSIAVGNDNDNTTGWYPQSSWNVDKMDGSANANNASGMLLDPSKVNSFQIQLQCLGFGIIDFFVEDEQTGKYTYVHRVKNINNSLFPSTINPSLKVGWIAASLGSTEELCVVGTAASAFLDGISHIVRNPRAHAITKNIGTTETLILDLRNRRVFQNNINLSEMYPRRLTITSIPATGKPSLTLKLYRSGSITGETNYNYVNKSNSIVEYNSSGSITNGVLLDSMTLAPDTTITDDMTNLDIHIDPLDHLYITGIASSNTSDVSVAVVWAED